MPEISNSQLAELIVCILTGDFVHTKCIDIPALTEDYPDENNLNGFAPGQVVDTKE